MRALFVFKLLLCGAGILVSASLYAEDFPEFPYPKKMRVLIVAENMNVNGLPMRAYEFKTNKSESSVVEFYEREWGDEMTDVLFGDWRILSHREGDYLMTVQIEQSTYPVTHGTFGITPMFRLAESKPKKISKLAKNIGKGFSMPPGSTVINDIKSNDGGKQSRTLLFSNKRSVAKNVQFYMTRYTRDGWQIIGVEPKTKGVTSAAFALTRGGENLDMSFTNHEGLTYGVAVKTR